MGIGQSYESYEKDLLEREVTKGFEELEDARLKLNDAISNLWGKRGIKAVDKLEKAFKLIEEFENANRERECDG